MRAFNVLLTGLSAAGKTTLSLRLQELLIASQIPCETLDGDVYRNIFSPEAGYTEKERNTYAKKILCISKLLNKHNVSCVLPLLSSRKEVRDYFRRELPNFIEVYVKCPIEVCIQRDPKGLYAKAKRGEEKNIVGIDIPYDEPQNPEIIVETDKYDVDVCVEKIIEGIRKLNDIHLVALGQSQE